MLTVIQTVLRKLVSRPNRARSSEVLTNHLRQRHLPAWTSFCVPYSCVENDQLGRSHFNWAVDGCNYHILRTGCFPYIKYHCTRRPHADLSLDDKFFTALKILNLGVPTLAYGIGSWMLVRFNEDVPTSKGTVKIFFLNNEEGQSPY